MSRLFRILLYYEPYSHPHSFRNKSEEIPCEREVYLFLRSNVQSIVYHDIMNIILSNRNERLMKQINNS